MRRLILLLLLLAVAAGCGGGGSLEAPSGAVMALTPTSKEGAPLEIASTSTLQKSVVQLYQLSVKDSTQAGAKGVRDTIFNVTFELSSVPGTATADLASLVTLCDGSAIINTTTEKQTDGAGIYNLCVVFKVGGGLNYTGNLRTLSGSANASTTIKVTSTLPAFAVTPATLTIPAGSRGQFTINGGSPEYSVTSSDAAIPAIPSVVTVTGGTFMVTIPVGTPKGTTVTYTVRDSAAGTPAVATVTVGDSPPPTVLPAAVTVTSGGTVRFTIIGGVPSYTVFSSNPAVIPVPDTVTVSGGTFTATIPANFTAASVDITVRDSIGGTVPVTIKVEPPPTLTIVPASISLNAGLTATFAITGGVPEYTIVSDNSAVVPNPSRVAASGDTFSVAVPSSMLTSTVTLTVIDIIGKTTTASLKITGKSNQTISFDAVPSLIVGGVVTVSATASSGLPVSFRSLTTAICTVNGSQVRGIAAGTCRIAADQAGNASYNAAPRVTQDIIIP
ncbi:MAG: hypothetical protein C0402_02695 [Thermodesulfovibrio sp.]|nr:hypothetical protein [Thermodesulfovibrio sp.]